MAEQAYEGHAIPIYSAKCSRKVKDIKGRLLFNLPETSFAYLEWWKICVILFCF